MDYSLPGSSLNGIFQARIMEWVAIFFSRGSSQESNPGLLHCRQILSQLSYKVSPFPTIPFNKNHTIIRLLVILPKLSYNKWLFLSPSAKLPLEISSTLEVHFCVNSALSNLEWPVCYNGREPLPWTHGQWHSITLDLNSVVHLFQSNVSIYLRWSNSKVMKKNWMHSSNPCYFMFL